MNEKLIHIADLKITRVSLSNRQYAALRLFDGDMRTVLNVDQALLVDQRSFGSLFHGGFIRYRPERKGFSLTPKGKVAGSMYESTNIYKERPGDFSSHFNTVKALSTYQHRRTA